MTFQVGSENKICFLFHSTHPRRVWHKGKGKGTEVRGFNPHTHQGCDTCTVVMGYTIACFNPHTHEGCDLNSLLSLCEDQSFNPHTHEGCDFINFVSQSVSSHVSIHTPTKGVTGITGSFIGGVMFQSTHPRRVWPWRVILPLLPLAFQSTHPRRVWPKILFLRRLSIPCVSIHTPTKGVTFRSLENYHWWLGFNPHTHEGCDCWND